MLNKSSSSFKKTKHESMKRAPFQELNKGLSRNSSGRSTSSISSSIDAPTGCLRFFLSNSKTPISQKPKLKSKMTTKSAPNAKTRPTISRSSRNPNENHPPKPKKKKKDPIVSYVASKSKLLRKSPSGLNEFGVNLCSLNHQGSKKSDNAGEMFVDMGVSNVDFTPVGKLGCGSVLDCDNSDKSVVEKGSSSGSSIKTPPVQASVSPELLRGSSVLYSNTTMTPSTCYGAGHVISGVTDKRKCRPKGVLTVGLGLDSSGCKIEGDNVVGSEDSSGHFIRILTGSRPSLVPLPVEASMSWHLLPCHEDDVSEKGDSESKMCQTGNSAGLVTPDFSSLSSSPDGLATNLCDTGSYNDTIDSDATPRGRLTRITLLSPRRLAEFQAIVGDSADKAVNRLSVSSPTITPAGKVVLSKEGRTNDNNWAGESSPLSIGSLSSGNVMQTPKSESSTERHVFPSWLDVEGSAEQNQETAVDSLTEVLRLQSLSPRSHKSLWDPLGLNFRSTDLSSPSTSVDPIQRQKAIKKHYSWFSASTFEDMQESETRISWREGLVSQIFEMDDLDCCRFMSDDENDAEGSSEYLLKVCHESQGEQNDRFSTGGLRSPEFLDHEPDIGSKGNGKSSSSKPNSCAESICTDGGGLVASRDSDWTICYKNQLFDV